MDNFYERFSLLKVKIKDMSDKEKIKLLHTLDEEILKKYVIKNLNDETLKLKYLYLLQDKEYQKEIILQLDDALKIKYIESILDEDFENIKYVIDIIRSLESDEIKIKYFYEIRKYSESIDTEDFDKSLKYFIRIYESYELEILCSLSNDNKKIKYLSMFNIDGQTKLIISMSDKNKMKCLEYITDDSRKNDILENVRDKRLLKKVIKRNYLYDIYSASNDIYIPLEEDFLPRDLTIGIELEGVGGLSNFIRFYDGKLFDRWITKSDTSLCPNSVEINSPTMHYKKEDFKELYEVCEFMKENKITCDETCAMHIHIGFNSIENKKSLVTLLYIFYALEEEIFLMSNEKGTLPREVISKYSRFIADNFKKAIEEGKIDLLKEESLKDFVEQILENVQVSYFKDLICRRDRRFSLNLSNANNIDKNTIEFRMSNGTLEPESIHQNIKLFGRLVYVSNEISKLRDEEIRKILSKLYESNEEEKVLNFLKLLFTNERDINYFYERFIENSKLCKNNMTKSNFVRLRYLY